MSRVPLTESLLRLTNPITFAKAEEVFVYERGTESEATLYQAETGEATVSQPLTTDSGGHPEGPAGETVWLEPGSYDVAVAGGTFPWEAAAADELVLDAHLLGAVGDGVTDDSKALKRGIERIAAAGGGVLYLPEGTYLTEPLVWSASNVRIVGAGKLATTIKLKNNSNSHLLNFSGHGSGIEWLTVDGNRANQTTGHCIRYNGEHHSIAHVRVLRAKTYGIGICQTTGESLKYSTIEDVFIDEVGRDGIDVKDEANGNEANYISRVTVKSFGLNEENEEAGIDLRGPWKVSDVNVLNVTGENVGIRYRDGDSGTTGWGCEGSSLSGFLVETASTAAGAWGLALSDGVHASNGYVNGNERSVTGVIGATNSTLKGITASKCGDGSSGSGFWQPSGKSYTGFFGCHALACRDGYRMDGDNALILGGSARENQRYGVNPNTSTNLRIRDLRYAGNVTSDINFSSVASANEVTLPTFVDLITFTGTTEIKKITASWSGRVVQLKFNASLKVADGENLKLASAFEATADDVLTLICNGTNWYEVSRSAN